jgi:hypothetical protein
MSAGHAAAGLVDNRGPALGGERRGRCARTPLLPGSSCQGDAATMRALNLTPRRMGRTGPTGTHARPALLALDRPPGSETPCRARPDPGTDFAIPTLGSAGRNSPSTRALRLDGFLPQPPAVERS